ncbi:BnaC02g45980D [Brassica napus]|uniref:BnaC02g45980D protein n=1 Tax=Brassica napus TaxID=3708 RepID=A0A078JDY2_BRANA|nr:BnaC02g45980D [Brassica napus]
MNKPFMIMSLPEDIIINILAPCRMCSGLKQ